MDIKLENELIQKYPRVFKLAYNKYFKNWDNSEQRGPFSLFGIECDDGWFDLLNNLCEKMETYINSTENPDAYYVVQIKEKWGTLRFYMSGYSDEIDALVTIAEKSSEITCECCAKPGQLGKGKFGWYQTLCDKCRADKSKDLDR